MRCFIIGVLLLCFVWTAQAAKILCIFPAMAHSHQTIGLELVKPLAARGHEVTFVTPTEGKESIKNFKRIILTDLKKKQEEMMKDTNIFDMFRLPTAAMLGMMAHFGLMAADLTFSDVAIQDLMRGNETFDVVIVECFLTESLLGIAHHFGATSIFVSTMAPSIWTNYLMANPDVYSYMPHPFTGYSQRMNFWQRTHNFMVATLQFLINKLYYIPGQNNILHRYIPNAPDIYELIKNVSLHLVNSDSAFAGPLPMTQNMVEIGGFHVQPPKKLPDDLQEYLDAGKEGVIYFSMGGNLKSKDMPQAKREELLRVFSTRKQRVLWKFEEDLPGKSENVEIRKWLPQSDVLAHPNIVLFITHGGLLSTTESLYHGVPIIGIPVFGDQSLNMRQAVDQGYGISLPYTELTGDKLSAALAEVLSNSSYSRNAKKISALMKDKQVSQTEKAVFAVEYVIRHGGAHHLQSAAHDLNWMQYYSLDVILFLVIATAVSLKISCLVCRRLCCKKRKQKQKTN